MSYKQGIEHPELASIATDELECEVKDKRVPELLQQMISTDHLVEEVELDEYTPLSIKDFQAKSYELFYKKIKN